MPKMIVSIDGVVIKEVQLSKDRTSLGRRPYNDIVIDNLAVSGEHAVLQMLGNDVFIEDLNSTNGTYINGKAIKKQMLAHADVVEIGKYKISFVAENSAMAEKPSATIGADASSAGTVPPVSAAAVRVMSGAAAGREVPLIKVVTTIGKPGVAVAAITKRPQGFVVVHVEGAEKPMLNGAPIGAEPMALKNGDLLELAGTQMQFVQN